MAYAGILSAVGVVGENVLVPSSSVGHAGAMAERCSCRSGDRDHWLWTVLLPSLMVSLHAANIDLSLDRARDDDANASLGGGDGGGDVPLCP